MIFIQQVIEFHRTNNLGHFKTMTSATCHIINYVMTNSHTLTNKLQQVLPSLLRKVIYCIKFSRFGYMANTEILRDNIIEVIVNRHRDRETKAVIPAVIRLQPCGFPVKSNH